MVLCNRRVSGIVTASCPGVGLPVHWHIPWLIGELDETIRDFQLATGVGLDSDVGDGLFGYLWRGRYANDFRRLVWMGFAWWYNLRPNTGGMYTRLRGSELACEAARLEKAKTRGYRRSRDWLETAEEHLARNPYCVVCGTTRGVVVHHLLDFVEHREAECDFANLRTVCEPHHLLIGHLMNYNMINPDFDADAAAWLRKIDGAAMSRRTAASR